MIHGLFLDPRAWRIDIKESGSWNPDKYGVHVDLHQDAFKIPQLGIDPKYKFVIATEVWEKLMQSTLQYLRDKGLKIFLAAREPIKHGDLINAMFSYERFHFNGQYYFTPDVVLAAGQKYADIWKDKTKTVVTGYPRWDYYIGPIVHSTRDKVFNSQGIEKDRKIIFFVSYPPYHYKKVNGKDEIIELFDEHDKTLRVLEQFAIKHDPKYQVVAKIHPVAMKCYLKGNDKHNEIAGLLKKYYHTPTKYCKVVGDVRTIGNISKNLLAQSNMVVGYNSTMLLEAMLLNKPLANVVFGKCKDITSPYDNLAATVYSEEELMQSLEEFDSGFYDNYKTGKEDMQLVEDYIYKVDGKCCERICEAIKEELK